MQKKENSSWFFDGERVRDKVSLNDKKGYGSESCRNLVKKKYYDSK